MVTAAVTTASYSIRSPGLIDLLKAPELTQGPRPDDTSVYGDGTDPRPPTSQLLSSPSSNTLRRSLY
jgi:hypothetical protein